MAGKTVELDVRIKTALEGEDTLKTLKQLKQVQKEVVAGSEDYKKITQRMNDIKDATKTAAGQSQDLVDSLASAPGPIGMLGRAIDTVSSSTNKFGLALKATGIGLVVALVAQLAKAFTDNEKAMKKLEPIMNGLQQILGGIFAALEPVFDLFVDLAVKGIPYLVKAIGGLYTGFAALGSFLKNFFEVQFKLFGSFGKVLKGVFTLDWDTIKEGITDGVDAVKQSIGNVVKTTQDTWDRFNKGASEMTAIEKKNLEEQEKNRKAAQEKAAKSAADAEEKRKKAAADALTQLKADLDAKIALEINKENTSKEALEKLYEERFQAELKGQKMTDAQKELMRKENAKKVEEALKADKDKRQADFDTQLAELKKQGEQQVAQLESNLAEAKVVYSSESEEVRKAQDEIYNTKQKNLEDEKALLSQKEDLTKAEIDRLKAIEIEEQNLSTVVEAENKRRIAADVAAYLKKQDEAKKAADTKYSEDTKNAGNDLALQQQILDAKVEQDRLYYEQLLANANLSAEQRKAIEDQQTANTKANAAAQVDIEKKKFDAQMAMLQATGNAVAALADLVGKNTVAGKALAVAASLINTYAAIAGQLRAAAGSPGAAIPGYAIAQAIATGLVGFKAVRDIIATPVPTDTGGSGGSTVNAGPSVAKPRGLAKGGYVSGPGSGTSDSIPAMLSNGESVINAASTQMFAPLLSTINQIGGGRKFAQGGLATPSFNQSAVINSLSNIDGSNNAPIKTYVLASDVSNQMALDRAIKSRSTI